MALAAPADALAALSGNLTVVEDLTGDYLPQFGEQAVVVDGMAALYIRPPAASLGITGIGFQAAKTTDDFVGGILQCWIIEAGEILPSATLGLFPSSPMPDFSNFAILLQVDDNLNRYGWCTLESDAQVVVDNIAIAAEQ